MVSPERVLTTAFWEIGLDDKAIEDYIVAFMNSTYGIISYMAFSTSSMGDIFKMKKDQIINMRVPKPSAPAAAAAKKLMAKFKTKPFEKYETEFVVASSGTGNRIELDQFFESHSSMPKISANTYNMLAVDPVFTKKRIA